MSSVSKLERDIAATRTRLNGTIDQIQGKLTVSGIVDEVMGQAGVPRLESGHDFVLSLLRRHPIPVMIAAAGLGFAVYALNRQKAGRPASRLLSELDDDPVARLPARAGVRVYAPDLSMTQPSTDTDDRRWP